MKSALAVVITALLVVLFFACASVLAVALCVPALMCVIGYSLDMSGTLIATNHGTMHDWLIAGPMALIGFIMMDWIAAQFGYAWQAVQRHAKAAGGPIAH